ncbi:MAG: glycine/sarcosine/betaine reductase selenoprotein B family protein [Thermomicrobiales bacterium]
MEEVRGVNFAEFERDFVRTFHAPFDWHAFDAFSPYNPLTMSLSRARVGFITTAGVHRHDQQPFADSDDGDCTWRAFPSETPFEDLVLTHGGYDTRRASVDKNVVLPLDHLRAMVEEGHLGSLASEIYSFMGYITDTTRLMQYEAPEIVERLRADHVDLVLLAPT